MPAFTFPNDIEGYANASECGALYDLACAAPAGAIVELGTYKGRTAIAMALSGRTVYAVDRFRAEEKEFRPLPDHRAGNFGADLVRANAQRYGVDVRVIEADTVEASDRWAVQHEPIGMLFIDAGHAYEQVKADFMMWSPFVVPDGIVVFDDSLWPGVMRFLVELDGWVPIPGPQVGGLTAMQRIPVVVGG